MKHQLSDGLSLYYEYYQKDLHFDTIVFLNGLSQATVSWYGLFKDLSNNYNILLLDNIFQGQSDKIGKARSFEQHAQDVFELIKALGLQKIHLVGLSYGGAIAQRFMVHHTDFVKKAVLISTFAHKTAYFNEIGNGWKRALQVDGYGLMFDIMLPTVLGKFYFENPIIPIQELKNLRANSNTNAEALLKLMEATEQSEDYRPFLKNIQIPTLIVQGEVDILTTVNMGKAIAEALPNSTLKILKRKGHTLNLEAIPQLITLISEFCQ